MDVRLRTTIATTTVSTNTASQLLTSTKELRPYKLLHRKRLFYFLSKCFGLGIAVVYIVIPVVVRYSATVQTNLIFLSLVRWPLFADLSRPAESCGITGTYNFYLETNDNIKLGVWHVLPDSVEPSHVGETKDYFEEKLKNGLPVIIYAHGNSGTRGSKHRVQLYQVFRKLNYHVITFDYRGYADSSQVNPTEKGVINDTKFVYKWLRKIVPGRNIIIWGHSLGTGVSTAVVKELCKEEDPPLALVLESPFNNLKDEIRHHPLSTIYRFMPYFERLFVDGIGQTLEFASDKNIAGITIPILILHAEDDNVIPLQLGEKLYDSALQDRPKNSPFVSFYKFSGDNGYGHKYICHAPELPSIFSNFIQKCQTEAESIA